jgi:hypothetical protein
MPLLDFGLCCDGVMVAMHDTEYTGKERFQPIQGPAHEGQCQFGGQVAAFKQIAGDKSRPASSKVNLEMTHGNMEIDSCQKVHDGVALGYRHFTRHIQKDVHLVGTGAATA